MKDYAKIDTSEPKITLAGMILEGLVFVLTFLGILAVITILSVL